jgi:hypothetical protein
VINYDLFAEQYDVMVKKGGPRKVHDFNFEVYFMSVGIIVKCEKCEKIIDIISINQLIL